jgi:hypothetical protein
MLGGRRSSGKAVSIQPSPMNPEVSAVAEKDGGTSGWKLVRHRLFQPPAVRLHCMQILPYVCNRDRVAVVFQRAIQGSSATVRIYPVSIFSITLSGQHHETRRCINSNSTPASSVDKRARSVSTSANNSGRERDGCETATSYPTKRRTTRVSVPRVAANRRLHRGPR